MRRPVPTMTRRIVLAVAGGALILGSVGHDPALAESAGELVADARETLSRLRKTQPAADQLARRAAGILVFPEIVKGGLIIGAAGGRGVLFVGGKPAGQYRSTAASFGFQAGVSKFGFVMFLMDRHALDYVRETDGWEVGVGPNVTVADEGFARKFSSTTAQSGVYVFFVDQQGYFAGAGIEGTKITRLGK